MNTNDAMTIISGGAVTIIGSIVTYALTKLITKIDKLSDESIRTEMRVKDLDKKVDKISVQIDRMAELEKDLIKLASMKRDVEASFSRIDEIKEELRDLRRV